MSKPKYSRVSNDWERFYCLVGIKPDFGASFDNGFIQTSDIVITYPTPTEELIRRLHNTVIDYLNEG